MLKKTYIFLSVMVLLSLSASAAMARQSWRLEKDGSWRTADAQDKDKYLMEVARIKSLAAQGRAKAVRSAVEKLKIDFPQTATDDLKAFLEADMLFCRGKFVKAVRAYEKFLDQYPKSDFCDVVLERQFTIAGSFLAGRKMRVLWVFKIRGYAQGEKIMEKISDRAGDAPIGVRAALSVAESLEQRGKFNEAYLKWSQISSRWPSGRTGRDALLAMAGCKHAAYRGPGYDASSLISAKSYYEQFSSRYPEAAKELGIDKKIGQINEQIAYKEFTIGRYYERTDSDGPANLYYRMVLEDWPDSKAAGMVGAQESGK